MNTQKVFELRKKAKELSGVYKVNKLNKGLQIAYQLYQDDENNEWTQKALAWTLIDLCKYYIAANNLSQANVYYQKLLNIKFRYGDNIIENQKTILRPKLDAIYPKIKNAEELSKNGNHQEAVNIIKSLISQNIFTELHHETYGWIIYRYLKKGENDLTLMQVKSLLSDYINLSNERPSLLHSMILNFALYYSKDNLDFNLYNFFKLWRPETLRKEDQEQQSYEDKEYPSLISRVLRVFVDKNYKFEIDFLLDSLDLWCWDSHYHHPNKIALDLLREPFFWKIYNATKNENKFSYLWQLFAEYNQQFAAYEGSIWHSKILNLAERYMTANEEWRFINFFVNWNPQNFIDSDWEETEKDGKTYKPFAIKCLKKSFEIIKSQNKTDVHLDVFIKLYDKAILKFPYDYWLKREKALLLIKNNQYELAVNTYKTLVLGLGDKGYIWHEFASCVPTINFELKIAMLSKAILLEKNEVFLGEIRLDLAKVLLECDKSNEASTELRIYKRQREKKGWKLTKKFALLSKKTEKISTNNNNTSLYRTYMPKADEFAYSDLDWKPVVLISNWIDGRGIEKYRFVDENDIGFVCSVKKFKELKKSKQGQIFEAKLYSKTDGTNVSFIPLLLRATKKEFWSILPETFAVVDYINKSKNVIHAITSDNVEVFFKDNIKNYQVNDILKGRLLKTKKGAKIRYSFKSIVKSTKDIAIKSFTSHLAVIDNVNHLKNLFHFVVNSSIHGIEYFKNVKIQIREGDFIKVWLVEKKDRNYNIRYKVIEIKKTEEKSENLKKELTGYLSLKYKNAGSTLEYHDLNETEKKELTPNFGFVLDFYVPIHLIKQNKITENCNVDAVIIFTGDKWKIIALKKQNK